MKKLWNQICPHLVILSKLWKNAKLSSGSTEPNSRDFCDVNLEDWGTVLPTQNIENVLVTSKH